MRTMIPRALALAVPAAVAMNGSHLYWANWNSASIMEASLDDSSPHTIVTGQNYPPGVAVSS